jgi:Na+-dependent transporters of the SNF family
MDTLIALCAGLCVIPARFALDPEGALGGPSLLFVTMQNVFDKMGGIGPIFGIIFYLLVVFAAISSSISLLETVVAHYVDQAREKGKGDMRKKVLPHRYHLRCHPVRGGLPGRSGLQRYGSCRYPAHRCQGLERLLAGLLDMLSEGIMMPLGGLLMVLMLGYETGTDLVKEECEVTPNHKFKIEGYFKVCCKVITPLAMLLILYGQVMSFFG